MHKALREVLGPHVQQKGSLVDAEKRRFDFSHDAPMTDEQRPSHRSDGQWEILRNGRRLPRHHEVRRRVKGGAMALFGEKYGDEVRVLDIGSSRELCGARTWPHGDIGFFQDHVPGRRGGGRAPRRGDHRGGSARLVQALEDERHFVEGFFQASATFLKEKLKAEREEKKTLKRSSRA